MDKAISEKQSEYRVYSSNYAKLLQQQALQSPTTSSPTSNSSQFEEKDAKDEEIEMEAKETEEKEIDEKEKLILDLINGKNKILAEISVQDKDFADFRRKFEEISQKNEENWKNRHAYGEIERKLSRAYESKKKTVKILKDDFFDENNRIKNQSIFSTMFDFQQKTKDHFCTINGHYLARFKRPFDPDVCVLFF